MARTQVTGTEILDNTITGDDINESSLLDSEIPFSEVGFVATNIHDAIAEAKSSIGDVTFYGELDKDVIVPESKAMIMANPKIKNFDIKIKGSLVIL